MKSWWLLAVGLLGCGSSGGSSAPDASMPAPGNDARAPLESSVPDDSATIADTSVPDSSGFVDSGKLGDATGDADASAPDADGGPSEASSSADAGGYGPYGSNGPSTVTTATLQVTSANGPFTVTAYVPGSQGAHPVVILSSGFFQPGAAYAPYASRLASWGIVTVLRDDPNLAEATPAIAADVAYMVMTWLPATNGDAASALHGLLDTAKIGLAGHSRGGQIALLAAEGGAHGLIAGVFGLDPVDTSMNGSPQARTTLATIGVPVAFVGETTDSAASSCAPATDNYQVLYTAAASPAVAITAVGADHTMFEDPSQCQLCTLCTAGTASAAQVLAYSERYLTAFFARQLLGDTSVGPAFAGAGANQDVATGLIQVESK